jgi:hypothetical protein
MGFAFATTEVDELMDDPDTHAVFVATRHDLHADLVVRALRAGKHVFVEKPLCITATSSRPSEGDGGGARAEVPAVDGGLQPSARAGAAGRAALL